MHQRSNQFSTRIEFQFKLFPMRFSFLYIFQSFHCCNVDINTFVAIVVHIHIQLSSEISLCLDIKTKDNKRFLK